MDINDKVEAFLESRQVDEILDTPKAMQSYKNKAKASAEKAASSAAAKILRGPDKDGNRRHHAKELKIMAKRAAGQRMADKLAKRKTFKKLRNEEDSEYTKDRRKAIKKQVNTEPTVDEGRMNFKSFRDSQKD